MPAVWIYITIFSVAVGVFAVYIVHKAEKNKAK